ncbi:E3 ubiquitin-protein ligase RNF13 [Anthonomus grandis grandis]|uniref:E3 ubiquitin-protein ligase RNF13 n=1 Tax=Anthonomus grandis grandis TaxID=2921223 RepID=UPI002165AFDF|nr:E3 ubiquitin-protein ligase RNF13 [Anthonomus grandis grandis]XP_050309438.1 E3 ubiquitin-protein ligase RNF13 [Anthonomus grandis grandis]XP_050309439.1 E3 ubiquitin-protein ligase RNF13 [Anthonomus grandis grandis]
MLLSVLVVLGLHLINSCHAAIYTARFMSDFYFEEFPDASASFGYDLSNGSLRGMLVNANPPSACDDTLSPPPDVNNIIGRWFVLVPRYTQEQNCTFEQKARVAQQKGYDALIVYNVGSDQLVPMSAENSTGIEIAAVFISQKTGLLMKNVYTNPEYYLIINADTPFNIQTHLLIPFAIFVGLCFIVMLIFWIIRFVRDRRRQRRNRLPKSQLNKIPTCKFQKGDRYETCAVCLEDYVEGEKLRVLPCNHMYHIKCIDPWLTKNKRVCPICKRKVFAHDEVHSDSDSESDSDTTPLIRPDNRGTQGGTFSVEQENPFRRAERSISQVLERHRDFVVDDVSRSINAERQSVDSTQSTDTSASDSIGRAGGSSTSNPEYMFANCTESDSHNYIPAENPAIVNPEEDDVDNNFHGDIIV